MYRRNIDVVLCNCKHYILTSILCIEGFLDIKIDVNVFAVLTDGCLVSGIEWNHLMSVLTVLSL